MLARHDFGQRVPHELNLVLDTTTITPEDAAAAIVSHYVPGRVGP